MSMLIQLAYLLLVKANNECSNMCSSAANSYNPSAQMNNLLTSGFNCNNAPYNPLANRDPSQMGGQAPCASSYPGGGNYDQQQQRPGYPSNPYNNVPQQPTANDECEVTTSVNCKPKNNAGGYQNPSTSPQGPFNPYAQPSGPADYNNSPQVGPNNFNNDGGCKPTINNAIMKSFDCNAANSPRNPFGLPPTKNIIVGTTELPAAGNFVAYQSSCGVPNGACPN